MTSTRSDGREQALPAVALALVALAVGALGAVVGPRPASGHEFSLESVMNAFVKIEPHEAHLVIRLPLHVLRPVKFL